MAILGEGNVSTRASSEDGPVAARAWRFLIKASGRCLGTLTDADLVECHAGGLLATLELSGLSDAKVEASLLSARVDPGSLKPSVEAVFHAYLLSLPGVEWVGHTHCTAVNRILCSPRAREFAQRRMFPDEVVCCGPESVFIPYTDPGLSLAIAIRRETQAYIARHGTNPRVVLLGNHGIITLGATESAVLAAMLMAQKAAEIWVGAAALGGPAYLSEDEVRRIASRSDEHYRQRALNL
jgi:rhamnose utilization protein RhaD (predicted bifunctional aldolase and dehydrogenase)